MDKSNENLLCPSYYNKPGAQLFGIVNSSGFIDYLKTTIEIDETFVEEANKGRAPEKRFRFAGKCAKNGCNQWQKSNNQCGLVDSIIEVFDKKSTAKIPECAIREKCRWYAQRKETACINCNEVIRNIEMKMLAIE